MNEDVAGLQVEVLVKNILVKGPLHLNSAMNFTVLVVVTEFGSFDVQPKVLQCRGNP